MPKAMHAAIGDYIGAVPKPARMNFRKLSVLHIGRVRVHKEKLR